MSEPFFDYIKNNKESLSNNLYGEEFREKKYTRLVYQKLPDVTEIQGTFSEILKKRKTIRSFSSDPLSLDILSSILYSSIAYDEENESFGKRPFPSGGALYPLETYLLVHNVEGLERGVYHYSSMEHSIAKLYAEESYFQEVYQTLIVPMKTTTPPQVFILMTLLKSRCIKEYGSLVYPLGFLEAGHRGQNIVLAATAQDVASCPLGSPLYDEIHQLLTIDGVNEHHIYAIALGNAKE